MARTFNCGIGMVLIVSPENAPTVKSLLESAGDIVYSLGAVVPRDQIASQVIIHGMEEAWGQ